MKYSGQENRESNRQHSECLGRHCRRDFEKSEER